MTQDQISGYVRTLCTILGTLAGAGIPLTSAQIGTIGTGLQGVVALGFLGYSMYGSWQAHSARGIIASAAAVPGTTIVTQPVIAAETPANVTSSVNTKVVPS